MMRVFVLYLTNALSWMFECLLTETTVRGYTCLSHRTHYPESWRTTHCSYSLMVRAYRRSSNNNLIVLSFNRPEIEYMTYHTRCEYRTNYITNAITIRLEASVIHRE